MALFCLIAHLSLSFLSPEWCRFLFVSSETSAAAAIAAAAAFGSTRMASASVVTACCARPAALTAREMATTLEEIDRPSKGLPPSFDRVHEATA